VTSIVMSGDDYGKASDCSPCPVAPRRVSVTMV